MKKLTREFYMRDAVTLARELLGKVLVHESGEGMTSGVIVETEQKENLYCEEVDEGVLHERCRNSCA
ncbi:MAG: DNA-3-methyladenine glycosylase [Synergistaceae bacterium]|nr:DNA-3-methyladenine glycosylase [Synergistaceae bacterium]